MARTKSEGTVTPLHKPAEGLSMYEGIPELSAGIEIRNAAGGLNEALEIDPRAWHKKDRIFVALEVEVDEIRHKGLKEANGWKRVHRGSAVRATVIDADLVEDLLEQQAIRIEEAKGTQRLPFNDGEGKAASEGDPGATE